jgi:hypothetical protein
MKMRFTRLGWALKPGAGIFTRRMRSEREKDTERRKDRLK